MESAHKHTSGNGGQFKLRVQKKTTIKIMAINYHAAQDDFGSIVHRLQPMVLTNFVMWLDMKVAEFKVYGQMLLENENREIPNWYLRPNFDPDTLLSVSKQKLQVPVSLVPKKSINKPNVLVSTSPSCRNRSTHSQPATKFAKDSDKVTDSLEPTIVKHPRLHHTHGSDMLLEETDSSAVTFGSKECSQSNSPSYSTTRFELSENEKLHMSSVEALDTSVEMLDSSQTDAQCTSHLVPKAEPVDEEFEVIENRLSSFSDTIDMVEHNIPSHVTSVSPSNKTELNTEKVAKTLVQSDGTMFLMPQTDKDATDTSGMNFNVYKFRKEEFNPTSSTQIGHEVGISGESPSFIGRLADSSGVCVGDPYNEPADKSYFSSNNKSTKMSDSLCDNQQKCQRRSKFVPSENNINTDQLFFKENNEEYHPQCHDRFVEKNQFYPSRSKIAQSAKVNKLEASNSTNVQISLPSHQNRSLENQFSCESNMLLECLGQESFGDIIREKKAEKQRFYRKNRSPEQKLHERYLARERKRRQRERERQDCSAMENFTDDNLDQSTNEMLAFHLRSQHGPVHR